MCWQSLEWDSKEHAAGTNNPGQHTEECRARIEQEIVDKGDAIKLETSGNQEEIVQELDVSLKKRKIGEPDIIPGGAVKLNGGHTLEERI